MKTEQTKILGHWHESKGVNTPEHHNKAQHSPLPWQVGDRSRYRTYVLSNGLEVCELLKPDRNERIADAKLIVRAVNHADKLAEALQRTLDVITGDQAAQLGVYEALAAYEAAQ